MQPTKPSTSNATSIFHLDPTAVKDPALIAELASWLDENERARMNRFIHPDHRHSFLISHALMRKALGVELQVHPAKLVFAAGERGKPRVANAGINKPVAFSLTHTERLAAIAIDKSPIGLDAEWVNRRHMNTTIADRYFTPREREDINAAPPESIQRRFLSYWTLKEAYLKAEGWGIVDGLDTFEFHLERAGQTETIARAKLHVIDPLATPSQRWHFWHSAPTEQHLMSVAVALDEHRDEPLINCRSWQPEDWTQ
jgi:4'-phosphopantetheinyl transferase